MAGLDYRIFFGFCGYSELDTDDTFWRYIHMLCVEKWKIHFALDSDETCDGVHSSLQTVFRPFLFPYLALGVF